MLFLATKAAKADLNSKKPFICSAGTPSCQPNLHI